MKLELVYNDIVFSFQELLLSQFNRAVLSIEMAWFAKTHGIEM